jgi:hypothetical protein
LGGALLALIGLLLLGRVLAGLLLLRGLLTLGLALVLALAGLLLGLLWLGHGFLLNGPLSGLGGRASSSPQPVVGGQCSPEAFTAA